METLPVLRNANLDKNMYRGFAMAQMRILKEYMVVAKLNTCGRKVTLANGVVITCVKCFSAENIYVHIPPVLQSTYSEVVVAEVMPAFGYVPRIHGSTDGYSYIDNILTAVTTGSVYPLNKAVTVGLCIDDKNKVSNKRAKQQYGNIDWIGKNTAKVGKPSNAPVLTWKGPLGRTLPFDYDTPIPGFTEADITFGLTDYYTCFGPNIYSNGIVLNTVPTTGDVTPKVLGAAYTTYTDISQTPIKGITVLICAVNNHYVDKLGFFDELWITQGAKELYHEQDHPKGWKKIFETPTSRPNQCWFFNQSGNKCTQGAREYSIDILNSAVTLTEYDSGGGTYTISESDSSSRSGSASPTILAGGFPNPEAASGTNSTTGSSSYTITHSGNYILYSDYVGDERVVMRISVADNITTAKSSTTTASFADTDIYVQGEAPTLSISGPEDYTDVAVYTVSGGQGVVTIVRPTGTCGMGVVTATDECGGSGSMAVRLGTENWIMDESRGCWKGGYGNASVDISGDTKIEERVFQSGCCGSYYDTYSVVGTTYINALGCVEAVIQSGYVPLSASPSYCGAAQSNPTPLGSCDPLIVSTTLYSCTEYDGEGNRVQTLVQRGIACTNEWVATARAVWTWGCP